MPKIILNKEQVNELVMENKYPVSEKKRFLSRCIDGRYLNEPEPFPLALAGADAGELAIIYAAARKFGFELDHEKVFHCLTELIGGVQNFQFHTDSHATQKNKGLGCGHLKQLRLDPSSYHLTPEDIEILDAQIGYAVEKKAQEVMLTGDHQEGAVLQVMGEYSVAPQFSVHTGSRQLTVQAFISHATLASERHVELVQKLITSEAVKLYDDLGEDYLYESLSELAEDHLMETAKRLAAGLPLFVVKFKPDGAFTIEEQGII